MLRCPALAVVAIVAVVTAAGCPKSTSKPAPTPALDAAKEPPPPAPADAATATTTPATWTGVTFVSRPAKATEGFAIKAYPDGKVVFDYRPSVAPSVAQAPAAVIDKITAWVASPREPATSTGTPDYVLSVTVSGANPSGATYDAEAVPPETKAVYGALGALVNTPLVPLPCTSWDGTGPFTLRLWSQDYGVAPGPTERTEIDSLSLAANAATASGALDAPFVLSKKITLTADELAPLRTALAAAKLGDYREVFGGAGEGSNLRTISLVTPTTSCARSFTNNFAASLAPVFTALADIRKRLGSR